MKNIAVLITCHNRKEKTINCLHSLFQAEKPIGYELETFLVDDGSTDGTSEAVRKSFPSVNIIAGNGKLYWNGGMRLAWQTASDAKDFDFYLWLNDDTLIDEYAIIELLNCHSVIKNQNSIESIIVGACRDSVKSDRFSYGGSNDAGPVIPNGEIQESKYINGNVVLISDNVFKKLGNLSPEYTHAIGDFDYGLRAIQAGIKCFATSKFVAVCSKNKLPLWSNPNTPLIKRIKLLHSPKGLNLKEYLVYRKKFWGSEWIIDMIKAYLKALFPKQYQKLKSIV